MIQVNFDEQAIALGEDVSGEVRLMVDEGKTPKEMTVKLRWHTEGRGDRDQAILDTYEPALGTISSAAGWYPFPFSFAIPETSPVTYNGSLIRVIWTVEAEVKYGFMKKSDKGSGTFQVIPKR